MAKRTLMVAAIGAALALIAVAALAQSRVATCRAVPLLAENLLPNADLAAAAGGMPTGWSRAANGVELRGPAIDGQGFDLDGNGRALQLIGIANYVETPTISVTPGTSYCFVGQALTDSQKGSAARLRLSFRWLDAAEQPLAEDTTDWQPVALWTAASPLSRWSPISGAFLAPSGAAALRLRLQPASDDRIYIDAMQVRRGGSPPPRPPAAPAPATLTLAPWPGGAKAALSLSFDWETTMGGLVHSRSVDDPYADEDPTLRGLRMRQGVTTTLDLFRPYGIRATYYANGYNFLLGNRERRTFMGNPTFAWARPGDPYRWRSTSWATTPWFAPDPHGTLQTDPAWYFGDLVPRLRAERQDIQSHTFSHLYAGFASTADLRADLAAWPALAAERDVPPARSLAFPWSGSAGLSDADWQAIEQAGITSVTRTNTRQPQYQLADRATPRCAPVPGHQSILACPDFYLTPSSAPQALRQIDQAIAAGGMIDLWAHTEEVTAPEQIAAWQQVVSYAARQRDAGQLWIAPLAEIAAWQQALAQVQVQPLPASNQSPGAPQRFSIANHSQTDLRQLTLTLPLTPRQISINGAPLGAGAWSQRTAQLDLAAGQTLEITLWPA